VAVVAREEVCLVSVSGPGTQAPQHDFNSGIVLYRVSETGVAVVTLNRPERMNAWGGGISSAFYSAIDRAEADGAVRAIVITGSGRAFCAGADMGDLSTIGGANVHDSSSDLDTDKLAGERHPHFLTSLRKPVIAAINGACAGYGLTQALMCDVRFAAAGAKFTTSFARRGLIAEYGISWILPRVVGWTAALDLLLSGRVFYAEEAADLGLVNKVVRPDELLSHAMDYAEDLAANCSPSSMSIIKRQVYGDVGRDLFEASARAERLMGESVQRPDFIEGISSFFERRPPNFPSLSEELPEQKGQ
jgi:enoyl-CoA hydratase/carnithine racemase